VISNFISFENWGRTDIVHVVKLASSKQGYCTLLLANLREGQLNWPSWSKGLVSYMKATIHSRSFFASLLACLLAALPAQAVETVSATADLGDGLYLFTYGSQQNIFLVGSEGVIATDPLSRQAASVYRAAIAAVTDKPVTKVAYTSSFFDRVPGGQVFADEGAQFVAQENCKANLSATPHPDAVMPDTTYTDHTSVSAGDVSLELYYFGQSYGTCLSVMIAKPANIMLVHTLVTPPVAMLPADPTLGNYYPHNLLPFFVYVEELAATEGVKQVVGSIAVEGAGPLAPVSLITDQRVFWDTLLRIVETEYNKGTPAQVIPKKADMTPLSGYAGYDPRRIEIMMRRIYSLYRIGR